MTSAAAIEPDAVNVTELVPSVVGFNVTLLVVVAEPAVTVARFVQLWALSKNAGNSGNAL